MSEHIVLVHGMGQTKAGEFRQQFVDGIKAALKLYGASAAFYEQSNELKFGGKTFTLHEFAYNDKFEEKRKAAEEAAGTLRAKIDAIAVRSGNKTRLLNALVDMNEWFGTGDFFQTHWVDVLLYRFTVVGEAIRVELGKEIANLLKTTGVSPGSVHVVAHSLGTSVVHDTLDRLYTDGVKDPETGMRHRLDRHAHRLASVHLFANVSKVLEGGVGPANSVVKPGAQGCTHLYVQYNHELDPIPRVEEFAPAYGNWVSDDAFEFDYDYRQARAITDANVHGFGHYLLDPENHVALIQTALGAGSVLRGKKTAARQAFRKLALQERLDEVKAGLEGIRRGDVGSIKNLSEAVSDFVRFLKHMKGET